MNHQKTSTFVLVAATFVSLLATGLAHADEKKKTVDFNRDIKPLLSDRCFHCHGPDEKTREADLRLDVQESAFESAIAPGDSKASEIIDRLTSDDADTVMPPPSANKPKLTAAQVELFKKWIDQGANFDGHWSYKPVAKPDLPKVESENPIDKFVISNLSENSLSLSKQADPRTLARRVYFDLVGLPPSYGQVQSFEKDPSQKAFDQMVDQLLEDAAFGERMAMYWLDLVRYADTNGIHGDNHRDHALFRNYVIDAFNQNMPFDQFTREQLAGDLMKDRTTSQWIASGYNRLNMTTREGGAQAKEYRAKYAADRVRNASIVWLGSTLGCAECHDHKYDPFQAKDFYAFASFFADIEETAVGQQQSIKLPSTQQEKDLDLAKTYVQAAKDKLAAATEQSRERRKVWEAEFVAKIDQLKPMWSIQKPSKYETTGDSNLKLLDDDSLISIDGNPKKDSYQVELEPNVESISGIQLECLTDESFGNKSLSRANGNFVLTRLVVSYDGKPVKVSKGFADFEQNGFPIKNVLDNNKGTGWAPSGHEKRENRRAVFQLEKELKIVKGKLLKIELHHESVYDQHNIGKFRIGLTSEPNPTLESSGRLAESILNALKKDPKARTPKEVASIVSYFQTQDPQLKKLSQELASVTQKMVALEKSFQNILVTKTTKPRMMRVLPRGNWLDDSGEEVKPSVPSFLKQIPLKKERLNRMDLADWMVDPENPLVARVFVNRLWKICFGEGLVRTLDDFGSQGTTPTHPELLDWLAHDFVQNGWDIKRTFRLIVTSKTYQQSSLASRKIRTSDPANQLLSHQNRFRLDAEMVRDNALSISELLVQQVGGPSVKPYQPTGYWVHLNFPRRAYKADLGQSQYRRGLYSYWCRTFLHPSLQAFDAPSREEACVQRPRSNTPLQALVLLNDPTYVEAARVFAEQVVTQAPDFDSRLKFAFQKALSREPTQREVEVLKNLYENQDFSESESQQLFEIGIYKHQKPLPKDFAKWVSVTRVILNLHETIYRN